MARPASPLESLGFSAIVSNGNCGAVAISILTR